MNKQVRLSISGFVQGVFFRASARARAQKLGLSGFVRNLPNGDVEVVAEGEENMLERMAAWCRQGPFGSRVDHVELRWAEATGRFNGFEIR